jgi:hypothetical protein
MMALAWARGFTRNTVEWRGNRLEILKGSRLRRVAEAGNAAGNATTSLGSPPLGTSTPASAH